MATKPKVGKYIPSLNATEAFVRSGPVYDNSPVVGAVSGASVVPEADEAYWMNQSCDIDKAIADLQKRR